MLGARNQSFWGISKPGLLIKHRCRGWEQLTIRRLRVVYLCHGSCLFVCIFISFKGTDRYVNNVIFAWAFSYPLLDPSWGHFVAIPRDVLSGWYDPKEECEPTNVINDGLYIYIFNKFLVSTKQFVVLAQRGAGNMEKPNVEQQKVGFPDQSVCEYHAALPLQRYKCLFVFAYWEILEWGRINLITYNRKILAQMGYYRRRHYWDNHPKWDGIILQWKNCHGACLWTVDYVDYQWIKIMT